MGLEKQDLLSTSGRRVLAPDRDCPMKGAPPHLLMVPYPAQAHILPMLDLAKKVASHGGIAITFVSHQLLIDRLLKGKSKPETDAIHFVGVPYDLPGFNFPPELPEHPITLRESFLLGHNMGPLVDKLLQDQDSLQGPTCLIADWLHWWAMDIAAKLRIPRYALTVNPACMLALLLNCPPKGYDMDKDSFQIPGLPHLRRNHLMRICKSTHKDFPVYVQRWNPSVLQSDGVLVNTCLALESQVIESIRLKLAPGMPLLTVGPLGFSPTLFSETVSMEGLELSDETSVTKWLNEQPPLSVLYVSFGTTGLFLLTKRHIFELARGLEASGQRFLWAFRAPPGVDEDDPDLLPHGFEVSVKGRGRLVRGWAPQLKILAHPSSGAFLSSCGWNSSIESVAFGVPLIGWPSFADQPIISRYFEATLNVGITLPFGDDYFVKGEDFVKAINVVLQTEEGTYMRERAQKFKTDIGASLVPGGSSHEDIKKFADLIKA